ncbi:PASTA domain-containing protein [Deinococcus lacus]|uniref:PASTA domain-containing protein n=1 Tax=Deinococcus lacus TaxID=392561 RepID=A0ABW1YH57_9DEIO
MPRIEDMTVERARVNLQESGFKLGRVLEVDGTLTETPKGRIIAQTPPPGVSTQRGQTIQVLVSSGISGKETWLPDLTGLNFESAREHARAAGLVVTEVLEEESDLPENTVIRQSPEPYARVNVDSPVTFTVASAQVTAPAESAGALPIPPPHIAPVLPEPAVPELSLPSAPAAGPQVPADRTPYVPAEPPVTPSSGQAAEPAEPGVPLSSATFSYTFPATLPAGLYTVVVQDADGQRQLMDPTASTELAGATASTTVSVRGNAAFVILRDGQQYAVIQP